MKWSNTLAWMITCCGMFTLVNDPALAEEKKNFLVVRHQYTDSTTAIAIAGLQDSLLILQITDAHISVPDSSERFFHQYSRRMDQAFVSRPHYRSKEPASALDRFPQLLAKAKQLNVDLILLTGDIVNNPSPSSVRYVVHMLEQSGIPFLYTAGNHDWHYEGMDGSSDALRKTWTRKSLKPLYGGRSPLAYACEIKGINFVSVDNSTYQIDEAQWSFFKKQLQRPLPMVLFSHIPYYIAGKGRNFGCGNPNWGWDQDKSYEIERRQRWPKSGNRPSTVAFVNALPGATNLAAVFTGHTHSNRAENLSATCVQYITAGGFSGVSRLITIKPLRAWPVAVSAVADDWICEEIAKVGQSYVGWDVEIGDADHDGRNEILTTGCPDSRLYLFRGSGDLWSTRCLAENLASSYPGMGLAVKVRDLNHDGRNEILVGTGQETGGTAFLYVMQMERDTLKQLAMSRPECNSSSYTHNLAVHDLDGDGVDEVVSAYCGGGEIIRYDAEPSLQTITARKLHQLSGSGEESLIADVDNDGRVEYIACNAFRDEKARVEIFEWDSQGELVLPPRIVLDGFDGQKCFYASAMIGDVDNDGQNELIVGWKRKQNINQATVLGYRVTDQAIPAYTFAYEDEELDLGYFEKMMAIGDADNDGANELVISTRGDEMSENITSKHLGYVFMYTITAAGEIVKTRLLDLNDEHAESSWLAVGDADNDGKNEIVLATGKGDRTQPGYSYVLMLKKREPHE